MARPLRASPPPSRPGRRPRRHWFGVEALEGRQLLAASLVSVNAGGTASGNDDSSDPDISGNGRFVVFSSRATDLAASDTNTTLDVYLRDLETGVTQLVSVAGTGAAAGTGPGNGDSTDPVVSDDGRYVAFVSAASNLVAGDANARLDVFVRDTFAGTTRLVSVAANSTAPGNNGAQSPAISDDGRFVAFASDSSNLTANDTNTIRDVFLRDLELETTRLISRTATNTPGNAASSNPSLSGDGRYVVFVSLATDLASGGGAAGADVFRRDTLQGTTRLISAKQGNVGGGSVDLNSAPTISDDGRYVAFVSSAGDLAPGGIDDNNQNDVFRKDAIAGDVELVSQSTAGGISDGSSTRAKISADGRYVAFSSTGSQLAAPDNGAGEDVFLRDTQANTTTLVSVNRAGNGGTGSSQPAMTDDARLVAFSSESRLLVGEATEDRQVFIATTTVADRTRPTFRVPPQPATDNVGGSPVIRFTVVYEDNVAIDTATINNNDLRVTGPNGFNERAALFSLVSTSGTEVVATYTVPAPGDSLSPLANGTYVVALAANQVADRDRNFLAGTSTVGTLTVSIPPGETEPPTAVFSGGPPAIGAPTYEFSVLYSDLGGINPGTFGDSDVIVTGPNGYNQVASVVGNTVVSATETAVVYRVPAPGGAWDGPDAGTYTVAALPGAVTDLAGNAVAAGPIGTFVALGPDLVAIPLRGLRSAAISGVDQQRARVRVLNSGSSPASGPVAVTLFASRDQVLDTADATIGTFTQDLVIQPGAVKQVNVRYTYPQVQEGSYYVIAQVDSGNVVREQDESNNLAASFNRVGLSAPFVDLVPTFLPFTGIRSRLGTNTATVTIRNAGNTAVNADIEVALTGIRDATPEPSEEEVATVPVRVNLRPGQRRTFRLNFGFPIDLERGNYRLVATLDAGNDVAERDEANNRVVAFSSFNYA